MNLSGALESIREQSVYTSTLELLSIRKDVPLCLNLPQSTRVPVLAALAADIRRPIIILTHRSDHALQMQQELKAWQGELTPCLFAEPNAMFYDHTDWGTRVVRQRLECLAALSDTDLNTCGGREREDLIVIASARALMTRTLPYHDFDSNIRRLGQGDHVSLNNILSDWHASGYLRQTMVVEPGQYSQRGGIIDVWPLTDSLPVRIEMFGEEIDSLRRFDPSSQRSGDSLMEVSITPAREALPSYGPIASQRISDCWPHPQESFETDDPNVGVSHEFELLSEGVCFPHLEFYLPWLHPEPTTLLDYLPQNSLVVADDWQAFVDTVQEFEEQALDIRKEKIDTFSLPQQVPAPNVSWSDIQDQLSTSSLLLLSSGGHCAEDEVDFGSVFSPAPRFGGQIKQVLDHLETLTLSDNRAVIITRQASRLSELWGEKDIYFPPVENVYEVPQPGSVVFVEGSLAEGFTVGIHTDAPTHVLTDSEIFGWNPPQTRRTQSTVSSVSPEDAFPEFHAGECVVHVEYGIGRYIKLVERTVDGVLGEYIHIEYAGGDDLYVPVSRVDRLTRYVGVDSQLPQLSRLGSAEWETVRERTRKAVDEVARELLGLYAKREITQGHAFSSDCPWQAELEASFPYTETDDQKQALAEVKVDMERVRPMDRLICGDVGYGKTEVALRAAFKCAVDGKQVAILTPTTVLAQQHFHTFQLRMAPFPLNVQMLSRFRSRAEQRDIISDVASGAVDILIGTHRMLQSDVNFKDLGLVVVDEEQRFGVTHKEHLKRMRAEVDVLAMTATPIPRTLYLSLTGVRDISTINTPPEDRIPVVTRVGRYDTNLVRHAILREVSRHGQVFYVHNRVQTIQAAKEQLAAVVPEANLAIAHGQMRETHLEKVMREFTQGEHDVLICTSIIESGLDIPNANTLIVERADMFGLAQLYQLRGRVGRGSRRAYAYFLYQERTPMTLEARERMNTIAHHTELGSGYGIAMRDLEIRGTGDIIGKRQHGHIVAVGFHLYTKLLRRAAENLKRSDARSRKMTHQSDATDLSLVSIDLPIDVNISSHYITDSGLRLQLYRRLSCLESEEAISDIGIELADRFGPLPAAVQHLLYQLRVRLLAHQAHVESVSSERGMIVLRSSAWIKSGALRELTELLPPGTRIINGKVWLQLNQDQSLWKEELLRILTELAYGR